jgi:hypothetical protein
MDWNHLGVRHLKIARKSLESALCEARVLTPRLTGASFREIWMSSQRS